MKVVGLNLDKINEVLNEMGVSHTMLLKMVTKNFNSHGNFVDRLKKNSLTVNSLIGIMNVLNIQPNDVFVIEQSGDGKAAGPGLNVSNSNNNVIVNNDLEVLMVQNDMLNKLISSKDDLINSLKQQIDVLKRSYDGVLTFSNGTKMGQNQ